MFSFLTSSAALFLGKSAFFGVRIIALLVMARLADEVTFACVSFAVAAIELARIMADYGTDAWCLRAIAISPSNMEKARIVASALIIRGALGGLAWLLIIGACTLKFGRTGAIAGVLTGALLAATQIAGIAIVFLQAENQLRRLRVLALPAALTAGAVIGCLLLTRNAIWALLVVCCGELTAASLLIGVLRSHGMLSGPLPTASDLRKMLSTCAPVAAMSVMNGLYSRMDSLVLAQVSLSALATYTVANRLYQPFQVGVTTLAATVYGRAAAAIAKDRNSMRQFMRHYLPLIGLMAAVAAAVLWGLGSLVILYFLPGYHSSIGALRIFALMLVLIATNSTATGILWACNQFAVVTRIVTLETLCALVGLFLLVPTLGAVGAATALLAAAAVCAVIQCPYAIMAWRRQLSLPQQCR